MARVLVIWTRPHHLSTVEAEAWVRNEVASLRLPDAVERAEVTRLLAPESGHPSPGDWLFELHLRQGADAHGCLDHPLFAEWLGDLRLLGMRPTVAVARPSEPVR